MTENYYVTGNYKPDHSIFGGEIEIEDFNTYFPNKKRISNQIEADKLQETIKNKNKEKKYNNMTLEELRELRLISNTNGTPSSSMTDEKWQKEFKIRKHFITPYPHNITELKGKYSKEYGMWNEETQGTYHGCTNWQQYCSQFVQP